VIASISSGDVSSDGRLACLSLGRNHQLVVHDRRRGRHADYDPPALAFAYPRWSPTVSGSRPMGTASVKVYVVSARGESAPRQLTNDNKVIRGLTWLPDSTGVVYATGRASSFAYLPPLTLWEARLDGKMRQVTSPEASYEQPDLHASGLLSVTRVRMRYPTSGSIPSMASPPALTAAARSHARPGRCPPDGFAGWNK
jgi:hypothetical protein